MHNVEPVIETGIMVESSRLKFDIEANLALIGQSEIVHSIDIKLFFSSKLSKIYRFQTLVTETRNSLEYEQHTEWASTKQLNRGMLVIWLF